MSSLYNILFYVFASYCSIVKPDKISNGEINLNRDEGWSKISTAFCVGYTQTNTTAGIIKLSLDASEFDFDISDSNYQIAMYDDESDSFPALQTTMKSNPEMKCYSKIANYQTYLSDSFELNVNDTHFYIEIKMKQKIKPRLHYLYLVNCDDTYFPDIDFKFQFKSSNDAIDSESCDSSDDSNGGNNSVSTVYIVVIVLSAGVIVLLCIIIGWILFWKKKNRNEHSTMIMSSFKNDDKNKGLIQSPDLNIGRL